MKRLSKSIQIILVITLSSAVTWIAANLIQKSFHSLMVNSITIPNNSTQSCEEADGDRIVQSGERVRVRIQISAADCEHDDHLSLVDTTDIRAGNRELMTILDETIVGMQTGSIKKVPVSKYQAYGLRNENLVVTLPRQLFPDGDNLGGGMIVRMRDNDGGLMPGTILKATVDSVTVDMNHPLAGHNILYSLTVLETL